MGTGTLGLMGVILGAGDGGVVTGGAGIGVLVMMIGVGVGGASAAMLLVRNVTLLSRAFNAPVDGGVSPPAAGSISSSHGPHFVTEST